MSRYAQIERAALADALAAAGPSAPTLCEGWNTSDLAAHVVVRDRRPDSAPGVMIKAFAGWTEKVRTGYRDGNPYPDLVGMVRSGPSVSLTMIPVIDEAINAIEFFVHTEDVRRARPDWSPRPLPDDLAAMLWRRLRGMTRLSLRRFPVPVRIVATGHGETTVGTGEPAVAVTGDPGELTLFFFGRQRAARVQVDGDQTYAAKLRVARLGV
jgi:uncharacterized protein (TIGR03085 family)